ncbi:MAG: hypothetical protein WD767_20045 [Alphaproteobacteria bacterium]
MRNAIMAAIAVAAAGMALPGPAAGRALCGDRDGFVAGLERQFGEHRSIEAVTSAGALMEIFVSGSGSWTILVTLPGGPACLVASGTGWQPVRIPGRDA